MSVQEQLAKEAMGCVGCLKFIIVGFGLFFVLILIFGMLSQS